MCDRPRCDEPCGKVIESCGHPCIGLCGEVCPPLCRICDKEKLTEFILSGREDEEDARYLVKNENNLKISPRLLIYFKNRFVLLEDCGHCIEVEGMDRWMSQEGEEIQIRSCPRCKTTVVSSLRYNDVLKRHFQDIVQVKKKLLNSKMDPKLFAEKLSGKIHQLSTFLNSSSMPPKVKQHRIHQLMTAALAEIQPNVKPSRHGRKETLPCLDNNQRYLFEVQVDVLARVLDVLKKAPKVSTPSTVQPVIRNAQSSPSVEMKEPFMLDIFDRLLRVIQSLMDRRQFSAEEYRAFIAEVDRMNLVRAFFLLLSSSTYRAGMPLVDQEVNQLETKLMKNVKTLTDADKTDIKAMLTSLGKKLQTGLGISEIERQEIVRAMGLAQGHWYKCPNGHVYAIGECGRAMQESRCPECCARIGGQSHRLISDNQVAREMDGARYAAWSEQANMANYGEFF